ncbi:MAG: cysteine--tRNA ligase, partial [Actinomycetota bacterium]|nr:cysteine--tRNA ligase [Actinomycetota bacterium]
TWAVIEGAQTTLDRWRKNVAAWATSPSEPIPDELQQGFLSAAEDDLDTPRALQVLRAVERDSDLTDGARFEFFAWADRLLGLDLVRRVGQATEADPLPDDILALAAERQEARAQRDFATSDRLRDQLAARGFTVTDTADGQVIDRSDA